MAKETHLVSQRMMKLVENTTENRYFNIREKAGHERLPWCSLHQQATNAHR